MREDTKEICELMDKAVDLAKQRRLEECQHLLKKIAKLMTQWVERHLNP